MNATYEQRVLAINWQNLETAYGNAAGLESKLIALQSDNHEAAMAASHDLWCRLCHQHVYVSSAARPAYPFLTEILETADEKLAIEILDILLGFSKCTHPSYPTDNGAPPGWRTELFEAMFNDISTFEPYRLSPNQAVRSLAEGIIENLRAETLEGADNQRDIFIESKQMDTKSTSWRVLLRKLFG